MGRKFRQKRRGDERPLPEAAAAPPRESGRWQTLGICAGLLVLVAAVYGQSVRFDFVNLDDNQYVYQNPQLENGLTARGIAWAFTETHRASHWHPLTWLSLLLDYQIYGLHHAGGYHLTNVLLHAVTAVLLFLILRRMTGDTWPSAFVAAVFAVHPLHVESVAWITERKDVLSGLLGVLTLGAYSWYARRPGVTRYLAVAAALALGLMAKPMLVTWPFLLLLLDYWPLRRQLKVGLLLEKVPLLLLVAASAACTFLVQRSGGAVISLQAMPLSVRILRAAMLYVDYLGKTLLPMNLAVYPAESPGESGPAVAAMFLLALLTLAAVWRARRGERWLVMGWFWYLGTLLPTIGLVQVGTQVRADRFVYLPQIGLCIAAAWTAAHVVASMKLSANVDRQVLPRRICAVAAGLVVVALAGAAYRQTGCWRDSDALWTHTLACTKRHCVARYNYGQYLVDHGRAKEAIEHLREAVLVKPDFAEAENELGNALVASGQTPAAIEHFQKAIAIEHDFADAYGNLGVALVRCGRAKEAIEQFQKSLDFGSRPAEAHTNLGNALAASGQNNAAIEHYQQALAANAKYADAHYGLAAEYLLAGNIAGAIEHFQSVLKIAPDNPVAENNLGVALLRAKRPDEAAEHFRRALQLRPDYLEARRNLQACLGQ